MNDDDTEQTFFFKEKRSEVSWDTDPYNALFRARSSSQGLSHLYSTEHNYQLNNNYTVWTNGTTAIFSKSTPMHLTTEPLKSGAVIGSQGNSVAPVQHKKINLADTPKNISGQEKRRRLPSKANSENEFRDSVIAGSAAGITSCLLFHPFDVVRTKMQTSTKLNTAARAATASSRQAGVTLLSTSANSSAAAASVAATRISSTSGPMAVISHTIKNGGIRAFYTGISLPLAAQAAYKATVFTTNRMSTNLLVDFKTKEQWKTGTFTPYKTKIEDHFFCGATSGAVNALLFVSPVEFARNQLIAQHTRIAEGTQPKASFMHGPIDVMKSTLKTKGIIGLWRGAGVTLLRDSVGCGTFFVCFELGKKHIPSITGTLPDSTLTTTGAGLMAGFGYWFVSLPLDALKTMVQTGMAKSATGIISTLVRRDGIVGGVSQLYRGWQLAFGRGSPSAAITLSTYAAVYNFCDTNF